MGELSKTPEEIKKGLEYHAGETASCFRCGYDDLSYGACSEMLCKDALAFIRQLEAGIEEWEMVATSPGVVEDMARENAELLEKVKLLEQERDAAIYDLKKTRECTTCEYVKKSPSELPCVSCGIILKNYEWRGPCEENS